MAEKYVNIRYILDRILVHPLLQDLTLEQAVNYTIDFIRIVGVPSMFEEKVTKINIEKYRALLPCDFHRVIQIRNKDNKCFIYSSDSFHMSEKKEHNLTYKIQGGIIYTSIEEGEIELAYEAIAVDSEGYPLIPDNSSFSRALELYIKKQWFTILYDLNKIPQNVYQNTLQEYSWAVGDCQTEFNRLSIDKAESLFNSWKSILMNTNHHSTGFKYNNGKENFKIH